MLTLVLPVAMANPPKLTWEHDCKDVEGNDERFGLWKATVKGADASVVSEQSLPDTDCALREWTLEAFDLGGERQFSIDLVAVDEAGNESDAAVVDWTATDTIPPTGANIINLEFTCPAGYTCNVKINGVNQ